MRREGSSSPCGRPALAFSSTGEDCGLLLHASFHSLSLPSTVLVQPVTGLCLPSVWLFFTHLRGSIKFPFHFSKPNSNSLLEDLV